MQTTTVPPTEDSFRLLVFLVDFPDGADSGTRGTHLSGQEAGLISQALFEPGLDLRQLDHRRLLSGSLADFVGAQRPGMRFTGDVVGNGGPVAFPAGAEVVDGWYQYRLQPGESPYFSPNTEASLFAFYRALFARLGTDADRPSFLRANGGSYDGVYVFFAMGEGGLYREPFAWGGAKIGGSGLGNTRVNGAMVAGTPFVWLGTACHELLAHGISDMRDYYGPVMADYNVWDIHSVGSWLGAFPGPTSGLVRRWQDWPRVETTVERGESGTVHLARPARGQLRHIAALENSSVGAADELVVEYRDVDPEDDRLDSAGGGRPRGGAPGLLIVDADHHARGRFMSHPDQDGVPPVGFTRENEQEESGDKGVYPLAPVAELKRRLGDELPERDDLWPAGSSFTARDPGARDLSPLVSSANRDGDVLWEFDGLREDHDGFQFDAHWRGRSVAEAATSDRAEWRGRRGEPAPAPSVRAVPERVGLFERSFRHNLVLDLTVAENGSLEGSFPIETFATGGRLVGVVAFGAPGTPSAQRLGRGTVSVLIEDRAAGTPPVEIVSAQLATADSARSIEVSADLSRWRGREVTMVIRADAVAPATLLLAGWYVFVNADTVRFDGVAQADRTRALVDEQVLQRPVEDEEGAIGRLHNVELEDGVVYGTVLGMRPACRPGARVVWASPAIEVPADGALVRGSVGFQASARGRSEGVMVRVIIDDGVHRLLARTWNRPFVDRVPSYLAQGKAVLAGAGPTQPYGFEEPVREVARGLAWSGEQTGAWTGDWIRAGDFRGSGHDDVAIFTGGSHPRVAVARYEGGRFETPEVWHDWFCLDGEYPLAGRLDGSSKAGIVSFTRAGEAYVALSDGSRFVGTGERWGTDLTLGAHDIPLLADFDGDGRDDVAVIVNTSYGSRTSGEVWVARNLGDRFAPPVRWLTGFPVGDACTPLAGDLTGDGRSDLLTIDHNTGNVHVALSVGDGFRAPSPWLTGTGPRGAPVRRRPAGLSGLAVAWPPHPGTSPSGRRPAFLTTRDGVPHLVWFDRPVDGRSPDDVVVAAVDGPGFAGPRVWHPSFGMDLEWPVVGDFNGDGLFDLLTVRGSAPRPEPLVYFGESDHVPDRAPRFAGQLFVAPKAGHMREVGSWEGRLNRIVLDLTEYAGRTVSIELEVIAGPHPGEDLACWSSLKFLVRHQQLVVEPVPDPDI